MTDLQLWPEEQLVLRRFVKEPVSSWANGNVFLDPRHNKIGGPYSSEFAPYQDEMMDALGDDDTEEVVLMTSTQVGKTQVVLNWVQHTVAEDPGPMLMVLPTEDDGKTFVERRIKPSIQGSPEVRKHATGRRVDWKTLELAFAGCVVYVAGANSPGALAGKPIRKLAMDEVDKFPKFAGDEADPVSLATERTRTYSDRKHLISSTPTTPDGYIWNAWKRSDQARYHVPCPKCGEFQPLDFSRERVRWPEDVRDPDYLEQERLAVYVCRACSVHIPDRPEIKREMLQKGLWVPEGHSVVQGAVDPPRKARVRGFHLNALYSPFLSWSEVAGKFLRAKDDSAQLMNFHNSWLGWVWEEAQRETTLAQVNARQLGYSRGTFPEGGLVLTAGCDVKRDAIHWVIRAWGYREQNWLVDEGQVESFEALGNVLFATAYERADGVRMPVRLACIDYQYASDQVIQFCLRWPHVARPVRGQQTAAAPVQANRLERDHMGRPAGLRLWTVNTTHFKDKLARFREAEPGQRGEWWLFKGASEEYRAAQTAEKKVVHRSKKTGKVTMAWQERRGAPPNHFLDCEVYAAAAAEMIHVYALRDDEEAVQPSSLFAQQQMRPERMTKGQAVRMDKSGRRRRGSWIRGD